MFYVAVPAGSNLRHSAVEHGEAVGYHYTGVVGFVAHTAHINRYYVAVTQQLFFVGHEPHPKRVFICVFARCSRQEFCLLHALALSVGSITATHNVSLEGWGNAHAAYVVHI